MVISRSRKAGFFAELTTVIRHIKRVKEEGKLIHINWDKSNSLYFDENYGQNVWNYYFDQVDSQTEGHVDYVLDNYIPITTYVNLNIRETFNKVYNDYITLNQQTKKIIEENIKIIDKKTLGLHIRKTDKFLGNFFNEPMSLPIDDEIVFKLIDDKLYEGFEKIYLATDCEETYNNFSKRYNNTIINVDRIRGINNNTIHTSNTNDGYRKGLEALIDCYMLSKCGFLLRSTSNLSSFSMFMNLDLECININEIYRNDIREHEFNIYSKI